MRSVNDLQELSSILTRHSHAISISCCDTLRCFSLGLCKLKSIQVGSSSHLWRKEIEFSWQWYRLLIECSWTPEESSKQDWRSCVILEGWTKRWCLHNLVIPFIIIIMHYFYHIHLYYIKQYFLYVCMYVDYSRLQAIVFKIRISG